MEAERARIEAAQRRNRELDEQQAAREAEELLASVAASMGESGVSADAKPARSGGNTSVYVAGLTTYLACRQLESVCRKLGKVRRIKFYQDADGGLKGDAVVAFHSHAAMLRAIERLDGLELKPGVVISASVADFSKKQAAESQGLGHSPSVGGGRGNNRRAADELSPSSVPAAVAEDERARSLVLERVWDPLAPRDGTRFFDELEEDMRSECAKCGQVERVHLAADGSVVVRFASRASAIECQRVMDGRWFDGRRIAARVEEAAPDAADAALEAFLASVDN